MNIKSLQTWNPSIYTKLTENGLTTTISILLLNSLELQEILDISEDEVHTLKTQLTTNASIKFHQGDNKTLRLSSGCKQIDNILRGGFPIANIIELYGSASVGKTQLCLQTLITVQLPLELGGLSKGAVYISTVKQFPSIRFNELCQAAKIKYNFEQDYSYEDNVYIKHCKDLNQFFECIDTFLPKLMKNVKIGLIIIDTISGLFQGTKDDINYQERSLHFTRITIELRRLSKTYEAVLLFVNEVIYNSQTGEEEAALGLAWNNLVVQKFKISKCSTYNLREFHIINSYESPSVSANFKIVNEGIK